jgi:hypothetical protein
MARLKIGAIADDTPVKLSVVLPATVHRDLVSYARAMSGENGRSVAPGPLVGPMLQRFMATDRAFAKWRRNQRSAELGPSTDRHVSGRGAGENNER